MIVIAALGEDGAIDRGAARPWDIPEEDRRYLDSIRAQTVIVGRRSYEIFGEDLTSRPSRGA